MFMRLGFIKLKNLMILYIVAFIGEGLVVHMD
jgi:hypothetical protein